MNLKSKVFIVAASTIAMIGFAIAPVIASAATYTFSTNLTVGSKGTDVMNLQKVLNMSASTQVAVVGAGSPGMETSTFGQLTKSAVMKWQKMNNISPVSGFVGPLTRAALNAMGGTVVTTGLPAGCTSTVGFSPITGASCSTGVTTTPVVGGSLVFNTTTQPVNSLAPQGAARVPFTTFTLTNTGTTVATVNGITVQRTGLGQDSVFSGLVLVDSNNVQYDTSKTLNSNHQAVVGGTFTINPGETKTLTVAGNMNANLGSYAGQVVSVSVVGVNSTATVSGSFPVTGASQTVNATLTLGSVSTSTSSFDPGSTQQENIGYTGVRFTGVKFTANSAEDLKLYSLRWRQVGTSGSSNLANVVTIVNGTSYPTTVSADGKFYTSVFPGGILIPKGNSIDAYIQGDLTGSNSAGQTVQFNIDRATDLYFVGQLYGYGISPLYPTAQPWWTGYVTSIQAGTATTIAKANSVAAQNIAVNVPNQVLGGFTTNFAGEPVSTQGMTFTIATSSGTLGGGLITSVSIVDQNGTVVAGPVDATAVGVGTTQQLYFTDTVTFPIGSNTYTLKGKIPSAASNGTVITVTANPSNWTNVTGQVSGNTISLGVGSFTMNPMTVKAANLGVSISTQPTSQSIVAGAQNLVLANIQLDASQSGEDIRLSSLPVKITAAAGGAAADLTTCQLWNGTTALNTGSNVVNSFTSGTAKVYSFNNSLTIPKGTIVTLSVACNVSSSAASNATYQVGADTTGSDYAITGVTSSNSVTTSAGTLTLNASNGGVMTVANGSLTMAVDPSSPSYTVVAGASTGVTVGVIKLRATNEPVNLSKIGLVLTTGSASDVTNTYLYNGSTLLGTATFTGGNLTATSTLLSPLALAANVDTLITIKADLADVGPSQSGTEGKLVKIDPQSAQGTGQNSGLTVNAGAVAGVAGVRVFNSYPTLSLDTLPSTGVADGRLIHFKVTANATGPVGLGQFSFTLSTSTATVTNINLYAYTDAAYSQPVSGQGSSGLIGSQVNSAVNGTAFKITPSVNPLQVPTGSTLYFELRASVGGTQTGSSVVTIMNGDNAYPTNLTSGYFVATSSALTAGNNFLWSGNATSTASFSDVDWSNGYGLQGLPSAGLIQTRSN